MDSCFQGLRSFDQTAERRTEFRQVERKKRVMKGGKEEGSLWNEEEEEKEEEATFHRAEQKYAPSARRQAFP